MVRETGSQRQSRAEQFVQAIRAVPANSKGANAVVEQEIVLRKSFMGLDETTRYTIINTLSAVNNDLARQFLKNVIIADASPLVRHEAAFALGLICDETCSPVLRHALANDKSMLVRHEAAMALAECGSEADIKSLEKGRHDKSKEVSISCEVALQRIRERNDIASVP